MEKYERLSVEALNAIEAAFREAQLRGAMAVSAIDLLLGLMDEDDSQANLILRQLDVDMTELRLALMTAVTHQPPLRRPKFAAETDAIIAAAPAQARRFRRRNAHTGHILLALLAELNNQAGKMLRRRKVSLVAAEQAAYELDDAVTSDQLESR